MIKLITSILFLGLPLYASASLGNINEFVVGIGRIIDIFLPIVVTLAVLYFFWGLAQFILNSGSDEARGEGRNKMIWGIVALFVIVSVWGLVGFLGEALGIRQGGQAPVPGVIDTPTGTGGERPQQYR